MPELPEVETVKNSLKEKLRGKKIKKVTIYYDNIIEYPDVNSFKKEIRNQTINDMLEDPLADQQHILEALSTYYYEHNDRRR